MSELNVVDPFIALRPIDDGALPGEALCFVGLTSYATDCVAGELQRQMRLEGAATDAEIIAATSEIRKAELVSLGAMAVTAAHNEDNSTQREIVERFNALSAEIYPRPTATSLMRVVSELHASIGPNDGALTEERTEFFDFLEEVEGLVERQFAPNKQAEDRLAVAARHDMHGAMREAFMDAHGSVIEAIESDWVAIRRNPERPQAFLPDDILKIYKRDLERLAKDDHESWVDWAAILESDAGGYRTWSHDHKIFSAGKSRPFSLMETVNLVPHEMYVHALRGNNGERYGIAEQAEYPNFEEGYGVLIGEAMSGYKSTAGAFYYLATVLARGDLGHTFTRVQLFRARELNIMLQRAACQKEGLGRDIGDPSDSVEIQKLAARAVNRIIKLEGQPAQDIPPMVFTYDTTYHAGLEDAECFAIAALKRGHAASDILRYLELGHFSPVKSSDREYVHGRLRTLGKSDWIVEV